MMLYFIAVSLSACLVVRQLKTDLLPQETNSALTVSFSFPGSPPDVVEQEVSAVIENAVSQLTQVKTIRSVSNYNGGRVEIGFDDRTDLEWKEMELTSLIRQIYPRLPSAVSYPSISGASRAKESEARPLLIYTVNAPFQPSRIRTVVEEVFRKSLAGAKGIREVDVSGADDLQVAIRIDEKKCEAWHITPGLITEAIHSFFSVSHPGQITSANGEQFFLATSAPGASLNSLENILLPVPGGQWIHLKDIAVVGVEEQSPDAYFRISGKNSVTLSIYPYAGENKILLAESVKHIVEEETRQLPADYQVSPEYDDTVYLRQEMNKNYRRAFLSMGILVLFILVSYRSWRYLVNLFAGLLVTACLTILLLWVFDLKIHVYTIAGLAVSFGIMLDNAIVMLDHYRRFRDRRIFMALLSATLTTVAALSMVFFLPQEERNNLADFSGVIILALVSSLLTALLFTPAFYELSYPSSATSGKGRKAAYSFSRGRRAAGRIRGYFFIIDRVSRYRKAFLFLLILGFGLPLFMLPARWEGTAWYNKAYNASLGSAYYQDKLRPYVDPLTGGALRLFVNDAREKLGYRSFEKTRLRVEGEMPYGSPAGRMNFVLRDFEKYLAAVPGIDKYVTTIAGGTGAIEITFREDAAGSDLPEMLKRALIERSLNWGGMEWNIYGTGQGFTTVDNQEPPNFRVLLKGYNFDELERQARLLAKMLAPHDRVTHINIDQNLDEEEKENHGYELTLYSRQLALYHTSTAELLNGLNNRAGVSGAIGSLRMDGQVYPLVLRDQEADRFSLYDLLNRPLQADVGRMVRLKDVAGMEWRPFANSIHRENRQYIRVLSFDYLGLYQLGEKYLQEALTRLKQEMPVGYSAEEQGNTRSQGGRRPYALLGLLLLAVFFISSILFENLRQPFFIICMIPVSFIGIFLSFSLIDINFDQGGYAAFVLLGGLVTNALIFIINDFNNLVRRRSSRVSYNRLLGKAIANRSRTILLTTISTCCGLLPFLLEGQKEVFWFSLAIGTLGGLVFSLVAIFFVLPVLMWRREGGG